MKKNILNLIILFICFNVNMGDVDLKTKFNDSSRNSIKDGIPITTLIDSNPVYYGELSGEGIDIQKLITSSKYDEVYRFAVEDEADIPSINSFNMYFAIGVNSITTPSCILIASYVSQGDVLNRFTFTLNEELSRDLLQALDYSDLFNLKNIQPHSYFLDYAGSMHIIAEKITNKDRIFIIRKSDASLPFDYTIDYLLKLIKRMRALDELNDSEAEEPNGPTN